MAINLQYFLHPDRVEFIMNNVDEQLKVGATFALISQLQDLKKAMYDMQLLLDKVTTEIVDDLIIAKEDDNTYTVSFKNALTKNNEYQTLMGFNSVYRALYTIAQIGL